MNCPTCGATMHPADDYEAATHYCPQCGQETDAQGAPCRLEVATKEHPADPPPGPCPICGATPAKRWEICITAGDPPEITESLEHSFCSYVCAKEWARRERWCIW